MQEISYGNYYNVPIKVFYIESDQETSDIPETAPAGSIAFVNEENNFHCLMKNMAGNWNIM